MAIGSISSIGIGSGLDLQGIIDQLREVDQNATITPKQGEITDLEAQLEEFTVVKNKLLTMKSKALDLSLASTFLGRTVTSSDESVLTATAADGAAVQTSSFTVNRLASKSSWITAGSSSQDDIVYVPTSQESTTGVTNPATDTIASGAGQLVVTFGESSTITVDVDATTTMDSLVNLINTDLENVGSGDNGRHVTASTFTADGTTYLKIETDTASGSGESHRVAITTNETDLAFAAPDTTFSFQVGGDITTQRSTAGVTDKANYITADDTLVLTYDNGGALQTITVGVTSGMSLDDVVNAINTDGENGGIGNPSQYVTAEALQVGTQYYLNIHSTAEGNIEDNQVLVATQFGNNDITLQSPDLYSLSVAADTTMSGLVDLINDADDNPGVTASVINNGDPVNPYQLLLQADNTGEDNHIRTMTSSANLTLPDLTLTEQPVAGDLNAEIIVDSITYHRQGNTINDVLAGVTLTLQSAGGSSATLAVASNDDAVSGLITELVEAYNDAVQEIKTSTAYDEETEEFGVLAGTSIGDLIFGMQNLMAASQEGSEDYIDRVVNDDGTVTTTDKNIYTMFDLGLEFNRDGTISIDSTALADAVRTKPDGVQYFFLGDAEEDVIGLADQVNDYLRTITIGTGQIEAEKDYAQTKIDDLELDIETATDRLDKKYEILAKQFIELDRFMNQMTALSSYLTSQFESIGGLVGGGNSSNK